MSEISVRERFLMQQAIDASIEFENLEHWLSEHVDDAGHTVEQHLSYDADQHVRDIEVLLYLNKTPTEER